MREAERQLATDAYLQKQGWWLPKFIYQQMFLHATATGQSEHDHAICHDQREPSLEQDLGVEPTAMELVGPDSTHQDI